MAMRHSGRVARADTTAKSDSATLVPATAREGLAATVLAPPGSASTPSAAPADAPRVAVDRARSDPSLRRPLLRVGGCRARCAKGRPERASPRSAPARVVP